MRAFFFLAALGYLAAGAKVCLAGSDEQLALEAAPTDFARRVELRNKRNFPELRTRPLRPEHLYVVFDEMLKRWVYALTDFRGQLPQPLEALTPGTVLDGVVLGGEPGKHYLLSTKSKWEPTTRPLQRRVWIVAKKPEYRIYVPVDRTVKTRRPAQKK